MTLLSTTARAAGGAPVRTHQAQDRHAIRSVKRYPRGWREATRHRASREHIDDAAHARTQRLGARPHRALIQAWHVLTTRTPQALVGVRRSPGGIRSPHLTPSRFSHALRTKVAHWRRSARGVSWLVRRGLDGRSSRQHFDRPWRMRSDSRRGRVTAATRALYGSWSACRWPTRSRATTAQARSAGPVDQLLRRAAGDARPAGCDGQPRRTSCIAISSTCERSSEAAGPSDPALTRATCAVSGWVAHEALPYAWALSVDVEARVMT